MKGRNRRKNMKNFLWKSRKQLLVGLALGALGLTGTTGCSSASDDVRAGSTGERLVGYEAYSGPLSINGIRLGMTQEECKAILGEPQEVVEAPGKHVILRWKRPPRISATFYANLGDKAAEIFGDKITDANGKTLLFKGSEEFQVKSVLQNARVEKHYTPTGSGIASFGGKHSATSYHCPDGGGTYTASCENDSLAQIYARVPR
jgi:hypothetical protein